MLRGVRGAIQVATNNSSAILEAAEELMTAIVEFNRIDQQKVSAVFFTVTPELNAAFPAAVRTRIGWDLVPFLCGQEIPVTGAPERILRVLIFFETDLAQSDIQHQYLGGAASLRPDLKRSGAR